MASLRISHYLKTEFTVVLLIYVFTVLVVNPFGEFPVNDDWIFFRQVEAFHKGIWTISSIIDPSFIVQGLLGYVWSLVFGLSFTSLRFLTILVTILALLGVYKTLLLHKLPKNLNFVVLFLFIFNPLVFISAFTFMTDNYFLTLFIWSIYFYIKYFQTHNVYDGLFGSIFVGLSILVRQFGLLTFVSFCVYSIFKERRYGKLWILSLPVLLSIFIFFTWPRHESSLLSSFVNVDYLSAAFFRPFYALPYFGFFLMPLLIRHKYSKVKLFILLILGLMVSQVIYKKDIFFAGNVLYIEELYAKYFYKTNLSLFDNILFTGLLSLLVSFAVANIAFIKNFKSFFVLTGLLTLFSLIFISDYYDRYLLPAFYCFLVFYAQSLRKLEFPKLAYILAAFIFVTGVFLQWEYFSQTRLRWNQANKLSSDTGLITQIFVDGVWDRFNLAKKNNDYTGLGDRVSTADYRCIIQKYTIDTDSYVLKVMQYTEDLLERFTYNPRIYNSKKPDVGSAKNNIDNLIYNEEYFSPLYTLIGKKAYVGSWCENEE